MLQAIVFDFDGVICDTEYLHFETFRQALDGLPVRLTAQQYFDLYVGLNDSGAIRAMLGDSGVPQDDRMVERLVCAKCEAYSATIAGGMERQPGIDALIPRLARRWPLAICSGARRVEIETILHHAGLLPHFTAIVSDDDVTATKPDPSGYRLAVQKLGGRVAGLAPGDCVAIEDTALGLAAAKAAGLKTIGVRTRLDAGQIAAADRIVSGATEIDDALLAALF